MMGLDVDPRELQSTDAVRMPIDFLKRLAYIVKRPILVTHESAPNHVILRVEGTGT